MQSTCRAPCPSLLHTADLRLCASPTGNWEYFANFVDLSEALSWKGGSASWDADGVAGVELADGWHLVHAWPTHTPQCNYRAPSLGALLISCVGAPCVAQVHGGDSCDKGGKVGGSVRVTRTLVSLKRRYPERVTLLIGNRDANKMRCGAHTWSSNPLPSRFSASAAEVLSPPHASPHSLTAELADAEMASGALELLPGAYWVDEKQRVPRGHTPCTTHTCAPSLGVPC